MNRRQLLVLAILLLLSVTAIPTIYAQGECSSSGTLEEFETTFSNDTNTPITIHWINTECQEQPGELIPPGESYITITYDGHEFVFRDDNGDAKLNYMVNTLIAGEVVSINRTISEGAAAGAMWETINPARAELGLAPIYFSGVLYDIAKEAAVAFEAAAAEQGINIAEITDGADLAALGESIVTLAGERDAAWAGNSEGVRGGVLASVEQLDEIITNSAQEAIDAADTFGWLSPDVQSFAVYADEHVFTFIFSSKSQPTLAIENQAREAETAAEPLPTSLTITGDLSAAVEMDFYPIVADNVLYGVGLTSEDFDTYLRVYDAEGTEIATNDDGGDSLNSLLMFNATIGSQYTIGVDSYTEGANGSYTLYVQPATDVAVTVGAVSADSPTGDTTLDVQEGLTYIVSVTSTDFDTVLRVSDASGAEVAADDDGGEGTNSLVGFVATSTGTYTFSVSSFSGDATGEYNLIIGVFAN